MLNPEVRHIFRLAAMLECFAYVLKQKFYVLRQKLPKNQFSKRNYVDSILEWGHSTWSPISKYDVFPASILFVFCTRENCSGDPFGGGEAEGISLPTPLCSVSILLLKMPRYRDQVPGPAISIVHRHPILLALFTPARR